MRPTTLLRVAVLAMGVLNLMPWAGPTMRAASVLGIEAGQLWGKLIPVQVFGIVLCLAHAVLAGVQEKKRGAGLHGKLAEAAGTVDAAEEADSNQQEIITTSEQNRTEALEEDQRLIERDTLWRKAGYAGIGLIGVLIIFGFIPRKKH